MQVLSKLATGPSASSDVSGAAAWVLQQLGAPTTRLKLAASAPIHAPYWRRRGLAGQIISPRPQSPYQPLGRPHFQPLQPLASPAALSGPSTFNMREETTRKANRHVARARSPNHRSRGERARVLNFKARDQISQSRCCDCVKISSESFYCSLSPQDSESLAKNFSSKTLLISQNLFSHLHR